MIIIRLTSMPIAVSTMASIIMPAPDTPAVPMEARVAVTTMVTICPILRFTPAQEARKMVATHW